VGPVFLLQITFAALRRNLLRSMLTVLGMSVGIAAVITIVALGTGASTAIEDEVESAGTNLIIVMAGNRTSGGVRLGMGASSRLTDADSAAMRTLPGVAYLSEQVRTRQQVVVGGRNWNTTIEGSGAELPEVRSWTIARGRFFGPRDVETAEKVAVIGAVTQDELFGPGVDPIGQVMRVGQQLFTVVGVLGRKGESSGGRDQDDVIFVPYTTAQKKLMGVTYLNSIAVSAATSERVGPVAQEVASLLRFRHGITNPEFDDFRVRTLEDIVAIRTRTTRTMTSLLASVAAVSLLVGGIGVMNIMLVSVTERTREVGLRMSVGAKSRDVLLQFLMEAIVICIVGGLAGVALGYGVSVGLTEAFEWQTRVSSDVIILAISVASSIGIFFGWYPARRAAATDPIDALRFE
jgi:putative ABC transport system permease protein